MKTARFFTFILLIIAGSGVTAQALSSSKQLDLKASSTHAVMNHLQHQMLIFNPYLPFEEDFESGTFTSNNWTADSNWTIGTSVGNPDKYAEFNKSTSQTNYESALTSALLNAKDIEDGIIKLTFDLKVNYINATGNEELSVQADGGEGWIELVVINNDSITGWQTHLIEITEPALNSNFRLRFLARGNNASNISLLIDNIKLYSFCASPSYLETSTLNPQYFPDVIKLEWVPPVNMPITGYLHWDDIANVTAIGGVDSFYTAVRFIPSQLQQFKGGYLTKLRIFLPVSDCNITLKVWGGINATQLLSQQVDTYIENEWNEFTLDTAIFISGHAEIWFGYKIVSDEGQWNYIASVDQGPANNGFGDLISFDGINWGTLMDYQLSHNWNIQGLVDSSQNHPEIPIGYNIYRRNEIRAFTTETTYLDNISDLPGPNYNACYKIQAIWDNCLSGFSNTSCQIILDVPKLEDQLKIYPNPANQLITIVTPSNTSELFIYDSFGQLIFKSVSFNTNNIININSYPSGIYFVKILTTSGEIYFRKFIKE